MLFTSNPPGLNDAGRRRTLDVLNKLNRKQASLNRDLETEARIAQYELAYRMQSSVPEVMDLTKEPQHILDLYGAKPGYKSGLKGKADPRKHYKSDDATFANCCLQKLWIEQGASWSRHWALTPLKKEAGSIDSFINKRLEEEGLKANGLAAKKEQLRRLTLDLTGLLPTEEERVQFLEDQSPQAYEKVVERLLASPRYGEKWASLWLDLARYADKVSRYQHDYFIFRGGGWPLEHFDCRSAIRWQLTSTSKSDFLGLRLVRTLPKKAEK